MIKYLIGFFINLFNPAVSLFAKIDNISKISRKAKVYGHVQVACSTMGDYSYIGRHSRLIHAHVGKFCSIAGNCAIGMGSHSIKNISTSPIFTSKKNAIGKSWSHDNKFEEYKTIEIGNDVWIGQRAMIMGGVHIGNGAVIGAGAIVTKDIPPYAIAVGVPAKVIKYRFSSNIIKELENIEWWYMNEDLLKENIKMFQNEDIDMTKIIEMKATLGQAKGDSERKNEKDFNECD